MEKCKRLYRYAVRCAGVFLLFVLGGFLLPAEAEASSGVVQLTTTSPQVAKGDTFTVVCQVTSQEEFLDASFRIGYDAKLVTFLSGGKKVTGSDGILQIASVGNTDSVTKRTFSLQFEAKKKGTAVFAMEGTARVTDEEGNAFSVSSNQLTVTVSKKRAAVSSSQPTATPLVTPQPVLSGENRLKSLQVSALSLSPAFDPEVKEYTAEVDADTEILYFSYLPVDEKARVLVKGNEDLTVGSNEVTVTVTAENGSVNEYKLHVNKESQAETEAREKEGAAGERDVEFSIYRNEDRIMLKNSYEFEVLDPSELTNIPAGYIQSSIELEGISIPAFTMEHDLDNNYLLLYLKGVTGERALYQYDRTEQTIQKYTGTMIERVNKGTAASGSVFSAPSYILMGIIVVLVVVILCMLIAMLKMAMKRRHDGRASGSDKKYPDDLDF